MSGAKALYLDDKIGNFEAGKEADFAVLDFSGTPLMERRTSSCNNLHEKLFSLMMLGDDRAISATYVLGGLAHSKV